MARELQKSLPMGCQLRALHIMQPATETIGPEAPVLELARRLTFLNVSALPVVDSGQLLGLAAATDIVRWLDAERRAPSQGAHGLEHPRVVDVMSRSVVTASPAASVAQLTTLLLSPPTDQIVVADSGEVRGVVTARDVLLAPTRAARACVSHPPWG